MPQINEFRGERSVQLNLVDIRPSCKAECSAELHGYAALHSNNLCNCDAAALLPDRQDLGTIWRYLAGARDGYITETPICLCRKIVRRSNTPLSLGRLLTALDIFRDVGLIEVKTLPKYISIRILPTREKADLNQSKTMQRLMAVKESE